jgi:hypothetical protein
MVSEGLTEHEEVFGGAVVELAAVAMRAGSVAPPEKRLRSG